MNTLRFSLFIALLSGLLWSCHTLPQSKATDPTTKRTAVERPALHGLLEWKSSNGREGVRGALIELFRGADTSYVDHRQSDASGAFVFDSLLQGDYLLRMQLPENTVVRGKVSLYQYDTTVTWSLTIDTLPSQDTIVYFDPETFEGYRIAVVDLWKPVEQKDQTELITVFDPESFEEIAQKVTIPYEPNFLADGSSAEESMDDYYGLGPTIGNENNEPVNENNLAFDVEAGQLTAGVLSDHNNWKTWANIVQGQLVDYADEWGTYPTYRYCVQVLNQQKVPLPNQVVRLKDPAGTTHWEARTDNTGRVELWYSLHELVFGADEELYAEMEIGGFTQTKTKLMPYEKGVNRWLVEAPCVAGNQINIAWVVDATGSMDDEIAYLQAELADVMQRAQASHPDAVFKQASVFYKSQGDDYVTRLQAFTEEVALLVEFMKRQVADGGQSEEAVEEGLEVAINELEWQDDALAKLLFLVLDEPPGHDIKKVKQLHRLMKQAAQKGIRIIPVAASGTNKSAEYLMRALALATNGHYVFLTDDSGIGDKHAEPTASIYRVEMLNDLLVRLIGQATEIAFCESEAPTTNLKSTPIGPYALEGESLPLNIHPNPAIRRVTVMVPKSVTEILVADVNGRLVARWENLKPGKLSWNVRPYAVGFYFLHYVQNGVRKTERLVVIDG